VPLPQGRKTKRTTLSISSSKLSKIWQRHLKGDKASKRMKVEESLNFNASGSHRLNVLKKVARRLKTLPLLSTEMKMKMPTSTSPRAKLWMKFASTTLFNKKSLLWTSKLSL
jgi:hypothetical protein